MNTKTKVLKKLGGSSDYRKFLSNADQISNSEQSPKQSLIEESISAYGFHAQTNQNQADKSAKKDNSAGMGLW